MNAAQIPKVELAHRGDGEPICRVLAETYVASFQNTEYDITEEMCRRNQYQPDGNLRQDYVEQTESGISRNCSDIFVYVARQNSELVGVGSLKILEDQRRKIKALYILPKAQGQGIGSRILDELLACQPESDIFLKVAIFNERAIGLYVKKGFEIVGPVDESDQTSFYNGVIMPEYEMVRSAA